VTVRFVAEAEAELDEAATYYAAQQSDLGADFVSEIREALLRIEAISKGLAIYRAAGSAVSPASVPFGLLYAELESEIVIVAVMHLHRRPDYWKDRDAQP
jgi:toxin ParE1/3/4